MQKNEKIFYRSVVVISVIGAIVSAAVGVLLSFLHKRFDDNFFASLISPVNGSIWEQLKLIFIPFFLLTILEYFIYGRSFGRFFYSKLSSVILAMIFSVVSHYTYSGIVGKSIMLIDTVIYVSAVFFAYGFATYQLLSAGIKEYPEKKEILAVFGFVITLSLFFIMTFIQPEIAIFTDPKTGIFGVE